MLETVRSTIDLLLDLTPGDLIGAVMIALTLALGTAGVYAIGRRKAGEPLMLLIALTMVVNVASMALAAGYIAKIGNRSEEIPGATSPPMARGPAAGGPRPGGPGEADRPPRPPGGQGPSDGPWPGGSRPGQVFAVADLDKDGRLTPEEAARFVRAADPGAKGWVDELDFYTVVRGRLAIPPARPGADEPDDSR